MLIAQLRGKLPTDIWRDSEDLLTSAVFDTLKNLPDSITISLLSKAIPLAGSTPPSLAPPLDWQFWPSWETCEPDIVLEDEENICVAEVKLYSDFGEDETTGAQLRREWADGFRRADTPGKQFWLLMVTNHASIPEHVARRQLAAADADFSRVSWLSWQEIGRHLRRVSDDSSVRWCEDLAELLERMGLAPFDGFEEAASMSVDASSGARWATDVLFRGGLHGRVGFGRAISLADALARSSGAENASPEGGAKWRLNLG